MKIQNAFSVRIFLLVVIMSIYRPINIAADNDLFQINQPNQDNFIEYKAKVVDKKNGDALTYVSVSVVGTNISTITNTEGEFLLKIPKDLVEPKISISHIGYKSKLIPILSITSERPRVELEATSVELPEIRVISKDAESMMRTVLERKDQNYPKETNDMTAFYRETIKKSRTYVSLSEAVVEIVKQPYTSSRTDIVTLFKTRKRADYSKLDTISFKLQGGPFNSLYLDVMKYPEFVFTDEMLSNYEFTFDRSTYMDNRLIFVLDFKQKLSKADPLYYGKLYIDAKNYALKSAVFNLNLENRELASRMFILKKPFNAEVYPVEATYRIDYIENDNKWYYNYSRIQLGLKVNWKKKLFKTTYNSVIEMAVTDWEVYDEQNPIISKAKLKPSVIISDEASGFSDPAFWGEYNVIEPEKSIESAIKKIQKQLEKK